MYKLKNAEQLESKNILNADYAGKNIVIRTCLNVAMDKSGNISDDTRIEESAPTLKTLGEKASRIVMMAHLGRPTTAREAEFSLEPIRIELEKRLGTKVEMIEDEAAMDNFISKSDEMNSKYYLVQNIRYFAGEESKDAEARKEFAAKLAKLGDIFVNDAFADYREAASTYDIAEIIPSYIGPVFAKEVKAVSYFSNAQTPFVAILGGAKLSEKLDALLALAAAADKILIGGAMAYTLLKADGISIGKSLVEVDKIEVAKQILNDHRAKLVLPVDHVVTSEFKADSATQIKTEIGELDIAVDIGPKTIELFKSHINEAKSLLWNGPMGVFEWNSASEGTMNVGNTIISNNDAYKFAGGGDSIAAINKFGLKNFNHISTGGGAMLAFVSYEKFPTLDVIIDK
jgi:phosphoglycerate kinase